MIGAGPGGYVAAIRAAQLGLKTAVVEKDDGTGYGGIGGVCLNWGCIPSKALLRNAELVHVFKNSSEFGFTFQNFSYDIAKAVERSRKVVNTLVNGVKYLFRKHKIDVYQGEGILRAATQIEIKPTGQTLTAKNVIIATGARPRSLPGLIIDGKHIISSREALALKQAPSSLVIVGGGAVGAEFAYYFNAYGSQVTVLEMLPHLLPTEDEEIARSLESALTRQGIKALTNAKVEGAEQRNGKTKVRYSAPAGQGELDCDVVLLGVGVQPNSDGIGLEKLGIAMSKGSIHINERTATNVPNVYAVGDVTGKLLLAHVGMAQGVAAAETIAGRETPPLNYETMPRATYCQPQVASFGLTEAQAKQQGHEVKVGKFPFRGNGKAIALGETLGMVKFVAEAKTGDILGVHMIGPEVTELLAEASLLKTMEGTPMELAWTVHAHPTLSEAVREAALAVHGEAIHI